jgi:hypothetical protein
MLQSQFMDVNKLNSAGTIQIGQRFETIAARAVESDGADRAGAGDGGIRDGEHESAPVWT